MTRPDCECGRPISEAMLADADIEPDRPYFCSKKCFRVFRDHLHGNVYDAQHRRDCILDHGRDGRGEALRKARAARLTSPSAEGLS